MKILQINKFFYPHIGGIEKVVYDLCKITKLNKNITMEVLTTNKRLKRKKTRTNNVIINKAPSMGTYNSMPIAPTFPIDMNRYRDVDIFHYHLPFPLGVIGDYFNTVDAKKVITWHSDIFKQKILLKLYKPILINFLKKADIIVTTSPNILKNSPFLSGFESKCMIIPIGIDLNRFSEYNIDYNLVNLLKTQYKKPIIFFLGRLTYYKGLRYLIDAIQGIDAKLLIGGDGKIKDELVKLCNQLGVNNKIEFLGTLDHKNIPSYYKASDLLILPSIEKTEAFGIVQLEAMASGIPVISTNLPTGVPFVNKDNKTGLVIKPKSSKAIIDAVNKLLHDKELKNMMGYNGQKRVKKYFTIEKMLKNYINLYKKL